MKTDGSGALSWSTPSTSSTTVTVTDNENTNEGNALIFAAVADLDGGTIGLESDGDATYNPSTGTIAATNFSGNLTGTLQTAAQPNVTSVGTLGSVDIDGGAIDGTAIGANSASTGAFTTLAASGATDLNSTLNTSGTVSLDGSANELRFYEGSNYVGFEAQSLSADKIWVLPAADGSNNQVLKTEIGKWKAEPNETSKIQMALNNISGSEKTLYFPPGKYKTNKLEFRSNSHIHLAKNARIIADDNSLITYYSKAVSYTHLTLPTSDLV